MVSGVVGVPSTSLVIPLCSIRLNGVALCRTRKLGQRKSHLHHLEVRCNAQEPQFNPTQRLSLGESAPEDDFEEEIEESEFEDDFGQEETELEDVDSEEEFDEDEDEEEEGGRTVDEYDEYEKEDEEQQEEDDDEDDDEGEGEGEDEDESEGDGDGDTENGSRDAGDRVDRPFTLPLVTGGRGPYPGPNKVEPRRRRGGLGQPVHRMLMLKPPMLEKKLAQRILASPQLRLRALPVLSSLLPSAPFREIDKEWITENMVEVKDVLGYSQIGKEYEREVDDEEQFWQHGNPDPRAHLDTLLYLAFQHEETRIARRMRHTKVGHLRLAFLGEYVLDLALAELLLQVYPRETPGALRERAFAVTNKRGLENVLSEASLLHLAFPEDEAFREKFPKRCLLCKSVFLALVAAVYLSLGMAEVYKLLFETFAFDLDAKTAQPKVRTKHEDVDKVSADFEGRRLTWKDVAFYKPPADAIFAAPRLFRACIPPGMYRFRKNLWDVETKPQVMKILGYPLAVRDDSPAITEARNLELGLGLQLCFMHASKYKGDHPRFCNERLEYIGSKIQDVVMAERLLMTHLDAPSLFLQRRHRTLTINRICGRRLRIKRLHRFIEYGEERLVEFERNRRLRTFTHSAVQQAIHGLGYVVYGKPEVRRLMFDIFETEKPLPTQADFNDMLASQGRRFVNTLQPTY